MREEIGKQCRELSRVAAFGKWVHPDDYHITLQFLGDTSAVRIPALMDALEAAARGREAFTLSLKDWGTFGTAAAPRVLWAGVGGDTAELHELQRAVLAATAPLGYIPENRPYKPHITLARRFRGEKAFDQAVLQPGNSMGHKEWTVSGFVLFATRMKANPMYEVLGEMPFYKK